MAEEIQVCGKVVYKAYMGIRTVPIYKIIDFDTNNGERRSIYGGFPDNGNLY